MCAVVFAGPSLHGIAPSNFGAFEFRPPAACGDILAALHEGATAIGLIDGVFENTAAVWHKEILAALGRGVAVYGAASMGALRAAECHAFGMVGIGRIFDDYAAGRRVADADVAVVHAPADFDFKPLTEALVDVEVTIETLLARGFVAKNEALHLVERARRFHYKERTWPALLEAIPAESQRREEIRGALSRYAVKQKQADAVALLRHMQVDALVPRIDVARCEPMQHTLFLQTLERRVLHQEGGGR
jgi:hypothetical protein